MRVKIAKKLTVFFLLMSIVPLAVAVFAAYRQSAGAIGDMILERLETLADERSNRLERMVEERRSDVSALSRLPSVRDALAEFSRAFSTGGMDSAAYQAAKGKHGPLLNTFLDSEKIDDLLMIDNDDDVVFSLAGEHDSGTNLRLGRYKDSELARVIESVKAEKRAAISMIRYYEPSRCPAMFLAAPVKGEDGWRGILAIRIPMAQINAVAGDYAGLGETGETSLVQTVGDDTVWVAPTRHDSGAAFTRTLRHESASAIPAREAASGKTGRGTYPDYRGVTVLAAWRHIPSLRLGLVIKMDEAEALAPVNALSVFFLVLGLITISAVVAVSLLIARTISQPITKLTKAAMGIAGGDPTIRTDIRSGDEIGVLAAAFNDMAAALEQHRNESEDTVWLKSGITRLTQAMGGDPPVEELASNVINEIAATLKAQIGAFYLAQTDEGQPVFSLQGAYAYKKRKNLSNTFRPGEGLVGQAALEKQQILVGHVPDDYVTVTSGLGEAVPRFICVTPFVYEGRVKGVIEVGTFVELTDLELEYLSQAMDAVAMAVESAQGRGQLTVALEAAQQMTERLQVQQEELQTTNEELEEQTQRLTMSEGRLKVQQEELQAANEELEEKNDLLERQKQTVEQGRREIEKKAEELALASKYKSEFLANMSHELRTPLNSMLLLTQGLVGNKDGNLTAEQVQSAEIVYSSGNDLLNLINEILDLSKIEAGRTDFHFGLVPVSDLADSVRSSFKHMAGEKGISLEIIVSPDAPVQITSDQKRAEQILRNLVSNAVKFTDQGGVTVTFGLPATGTTFTQSPLDGQACLAVAVKDTGIGISPDQQKIIFEAFQQADSGTTRRYGGTGLGLSISRELTRMLGGEIQVRSELGKGATFTLYLPVEPAARAVETGRLKKRAAPPSEPEIPAPPLDAPPLQPASQITDDAASIVSGDRVVLVVEDDPNFAQILLRKCHAKGLKGLVALSGEAGLELAAKYQPGAVILDIRLPGMSGWQVLQVLKEDTRTRHIPVHVISVEPSSADAIRRGAVGHAVKPISEEALDAAFTRLDRAAADSPKRVLLVEDDPEIRRQTADIIGNGVVTVVEAGTGAEAMASMRSDHYECMVLDLGLPDMDGNELLSTMAQEGLDIPPVIVNTARDLTRDEEARLREHADAIVIKDVRSQERLLDEVSLFLHRVVSDMPDDKRRIIQDLYDTDTLFQNRIVLVVDDDMRTAFAVSRLLADHGMTPLKAENGQRALALLDEQPDVALVLMDIMMPGMDGYETMRRIRAQERFERLPIIALTAKAMPEDREKCLASGANDYLSKPVDGQRLISMMRVWLHR